MQGKRYLVPVFVLMFLIGLPVSGYSDSYGYLSGNELVKFMREYEIADSGGKPESWQHPAAYRYYIVGVADVLLRVDLIKTENVTIGQLCAVVTKYLKANPEKWHQSALKLVLDALQEAFPRKQ